MRRGRPKGSFKIPSYRLHRSSGQAIVTINGRDHYLGQFNSADSRREYDRLVSEFLAAGRTLDPETKADLTVAELMVMFWTDAQREIPSHRTYRRAMSRLRKLYADLPVKEFGPLHLKTIRNEMAASRWDRKAPEGKEHPRLSRNYINQVMRQIRTIFRWGLDNDAGVPASVVHSLNAVKPLLRGRTEAVERDVVMPARDSDIEAVRRVADPNVVAMIDLQLLTGMRPGEVCQMRTCDIEMTDGGVWLYRPEKHKNQFRGTARVIRLGPKAQEILKPFLRPNLTEYIFDPREAVRRHIQRQFSDKPRRGRKKDRKPRVAGYFKSRYSTRVYQNHITRCCLKADRLAREADPSIPATKRVVEHWHAHQLRHNAATRIADEFGLEAARVVLGHSNIRMTERYSRGRSLHTADDAITKIG